MTDTSGVVENAVTDVADDVVENTTEAANEQEQQGEEETQQAEEGKKRAGGYKKKIERLTRTLAEKEAEIAALKSSSDVSGDDKPKVTDFKSYDDYVESLTEWKVEQTAKKNREATARVDADEVLEERLEVFNENLAQVKTKYADYAETVSKLDTVVVSDAMQRAILDSDIGGELAYYFGKNPEEFIELNGKPESVIARKIGRIEAQLEAKSSDPMPVKKVTNAPKPLGTVKGTAKSQVDLGELSYSDYKRITGG